MRLCCSKLQVDVLQGGETTAEPLQMCVCVRVCVCVSSYHAGGNVEDTVSSRLHGNPISFTGREAEPVHIQNQGCELFLVINAHIVTLIPVTTDSQ